MTKKKNSCNINPLIVASMCLPHPIASRYLDIVQRGIEKERAITRLMCVTGISEKQAKVDCAPYDTNQINNIADWVMCGAIYTSTSIQFLADIDSGAIRYMLGKSFKEMNNGQV